MAGKKKNILTIATGKKLYVDLATNLARSFFVWHKNSDINFQIVTDAPSLIPNDVRRKVEVIEIKKGELGEGFTPKLHLDHLASEGQTLFIDSDCLIFGNLEHLFSKFANHDVSVVGGIIAGGDWFGDIAAICKKFDLPYLPKFNGGIYYLEKGEIASQVYETARKLEKEYDKIGFVRLRNKPNDEVLMALSMQLHKQKPILDDGSIMSDPQSCPGGYSIDVLNGQNWLLNPPPPHPKHQSWYPFSKVSPVIVHFLGGATEDYLYRREIFYLSMWSQDKLSAYHRFQAKLGIELPSIIKTFFKDNFRPLYRAMFGYRTIKQSERI